MLFFFSCKKIVKFFSVRDLNLGMVWRGRNAAAKALHPPIVERKNIFSLYWGLEVLLLNNFI